MKMFYLEISLFYHSSWNRISKFSEVKDIEHHEFRKTMGNFQVLATTEEISRKEK